MNIPRDKSEIFTEVLDISTGRPEIQTTDYEILDIARLNEILEEMSLKNTGALRKLLQGRLDTKIGQPNGALNIGAIYPEDEHGVTNKQGEINGFLRTEEIATFVTIDPENGQAFYLVRHRPTLDGTNTPGALDPGVFSHGGIPQAGIVNAWRYVADKLGKNDNELSQGEYKEYLQLNPFPENTEIQSAGSFIIANGSNARNTQNSKEGKELEPRTSGLLNVRAISLSYGDFMSIYTAQNDTSLPTRYEMIALGEENNQDWTPKHRAMHEKLSAIMSDIHTASSKIVTATRDGAAQALGEK